MFCEKCGTQIPDIARFCPECGATIEHKEEPAAFTQSAPIAETSSNGSNSGKSGLAIGALICSFFLPLVGLILGVVALKKTNRKGMSIAAIIIAAVLMLAYVIGSVAIVNAVNSAMEEEGISISVVVNAVAAKPASIEEEKAVVDSVTAEPEPAVEENTPVAGNVAGIDNVVLAETEDFAVTIVGKEDTDGWDAYGLRVRLENKTSDKYLMFALDTAVLDGWMADPFFACSVAAGKAEETVIYWDDFSGYGFEEPTEITLVWSVYNIDNWDEPWLMSGETFTLYPQGVVAKPVASARPEGEVLFETDDLAAIALGTTWDDYFGLGLKLYLENKTDKPVVFSADEYWLYGKGCETYWGASLRGNTRSYSTIYWDEDAMKEAGLSNIANSLEVAMKMVVYDTENYTKLYEDYPSVAVKIS